jgi:hypothetical protein
MTPAIATGLSAETLAASERANAEVHALAECIAEYCRDTQQQLNSVRYLRRAIAGDPLDRCTHETRHARGGTGEWDEVFQCPEPGTVTNLADAAANDDYEPGDPDCPGGVYCLAHHQQREKERADNYEPPQSYAQRTLVISAADPDFA